MPLIFRKPIEVENRLEARFGFTREELLDIIGVMVGARRDCTDNDPAGSIGWASYRAGTRRAREVLRSRGYIKDATDQIEASINKARGIKIVVANTDAATGLEDFNPQNNSKKGAATDRVVSSNQCSFLRELEESLPVVPLKSKAARKDDTLTWYLCLYQDKDEVRAELSLPTEVENGFFADFVERIILIGDEGFDGTTVKRHGSDDEGASEFDIPVSRK